MKDIYNEDPSYWPHGLDINGFDGGAFLIRQASTEKPVGFVGWQVRNKNFRKVGSYAIGILPEFRGNGMAKKAVSDLVRMKAGEVDEVRAYIKPHNDKSMGLAKALAIPVDTEF